MPTGDEHTSVWRFCIAPMLDWTDRHCRYFHRQLTRHARLYTEMVTTGALLHGEAQRHLDFDPVEHPVALQLGGSEPQDLAQCARLGARWGYSEINLNCGCPSERVQRGAFGACLMTEPGLVADCIKAMQDAVTVPVTVKHRLGLDRIEDYGFVRDFVGALYHVGCRVFIVHARNAVLKGLSPKDNRSIPPLRYAEVVQLKRDFPKATIVLNGGLTSLEQAVDHLEHLDGVMLGRLAYHEPWLLSQVDEVFFSDARTHERCDVIRVMTEYIHQWVQKGQTPYLATRAVARHMFGLYHGVPGARDWRRLLSTPDFVQTHGAESLVAAMPRFSERLQ